MVMRAAVLGHPIEHSLSPRIYNHWFEESGFPGHYHAINVAPEDFEKEVRRLVSEGYAGVNVTLPHKRAALDIADFSNPAARELGAANLLLFRDGQVVADNTDGQGFAACLLNENGQAIPRKKRAVVIGAGGAAGPVIQQLVSQDVAIVNRTRARADQLAARFGPQCQAYDWSELPQLLRDADVLVNTTSLGMESQPPLEVDIAGLPPASLVIDIVYAPLETELLKTAKAHGHRTANGLRMLVFQAVPSFVAYTGLRPSNPEALLQTMEDERR